jgi:hypothetical protein
VTDTLPCIAPELLDVTARKLRNQGRRSFMRGWHDAQRFRVGLPPVEFGSGDRRDRDYADGWKSSYALTVALIRWGAS